MVRHLALGILATLAMAGLARPAGAGAPEPKESFSGEVVGVTDGDTIKVIKDGKAVRVRLYGIDCPEKNQAFGTKAKQFASELVFRKTVTVQVMDTDRYGRLVGVVWVGESNFNHELVKAGLAWWYKRYAKTDRKLELYETQARINKRGLWSDPDPTPPWEFRRR